MRRLLLILALALPAVLLWTLFRAAGSAPDAAPPPAPRPTDSTWPLAVPVAGAARGPVGSPARSAAPAGTSPVVSAPVAAETGAEAPDATPEPFVQTFAGQPGAKPLPRLPSPTATLSIPVNVDGCDRSYGVRSQCVPWRFPPDVPDKCAWLRERGFLDPPLTSHGPDRHRLDPDGNGIACDG